MRGRVTDEFKSWWNKLSGHEQVRCDARRQRADGTRHGLVKSPETMRIAPDILLTLSVRGARRSS